MNPELLLKHFNRISNQADALPLLRRFILDLAVRGKLVAQDTNEEPASELLRRARAAKAQLQAKKLIRRDNAGSPVYHDHSPFSIPANWEWTRIGEVATLVTKGSTPTSYGHNFQSSGINFLKVEAIVDGRLLPQNVTSFITEETHSFLSRSQLRAGDILFSIAGSIGTCAYVPESIVPANTNQALAIIRGTELVFQPEFLLICLKSSVADLTLGRARGGAMNNISLEDVKDFMLPVPPAHEQCRIVSKMKGLMRLCDHLEAAHRERDVRRNRLTASVHHHVNSGGDVDGKRRHAAFFINHLRLLTVRADQIRQIRQTILNLAIRGRLGSGVPGVTPASELLKRIHIEKERLLRTGGAKKSRLLSPIKVDEIPFSLPTDWEWCRLGTIALSIGDGLHGTPTYTSGTDYYFINGNNLVDGRIIIKPGSKTVSFEEWKKHRKKLSANALLVSINGTLGNIAFYDNEKIVLGKSACYCNLSEFIDRQFIRVVIMSDYFNEYAKRKATGTTIKNLSLQAMNELPLPLPPQDEQHRIVVIVGELMELCDRLESCLSTAQAGTGQLLESVLHNALHSTARDVLTEVLS